MMNDHSAAIENDRMKNTNNRFDWNYYTFYRIPVIINDKIISNDGMRMYQVEKLEEYSQNTKTI